MSTIMTRPEMATGTGSVTHRKMPATMSASDIFPASVSPSGVGPSQAAATSTTALSLIHISKAAAKIHPQRRRPMRSSRHSNEP